MVQDRAAVGRAAAAVGAAAPARGGARLAAGAHGAAERPRLHGDRRSRRSSRWARTWCARGCTATSRRGPAGWRTVPGRAGRRRTAWPGRSSDAQASNPPCNSGLVQGGWTVGLLAAFLAARFRLVLSPPQRAALPAPGRLALGAAPPGPRDPRAPRPAARSDPAAPLKLALHRAGAGLGRHRPVPGRVRAAPAAGDPGAVDEGAAAARPTPGRTPSGPCSAR